MHRSVRNRVSIILGVAILGAAGAFWLASNDKTVAKRQPAPVFIPVEAAAAVQSDVPVYLNGLGTVQAFNTVTVKAKLAVDLRFHGDGIKGLN